MLESSPSRLGRDWRPSGHPIWSDYMAKVVPKYPRVAFPVPEGISFAFIDPETGRLATAAQKDRVRAAFKVGTVPTRDGTNVLRIGEPGSRSRLSNIDPETPQPEVDTTVRSVCRQAAQTTRL